MIVAHVLCDVTFVRNSWLTLAHNVHSIKRRRIASHTNNFHYSIEQHKHMNETEKHPAVLEREDKVLIITRRFFMDDVRRHFVGTVERYDPGAMRVRGYAFVYNADQGSFVKRKSQRTCIFPLDNHLIMFVLPYDSDIGAMRYEAIDEGGLVATDGKHFKLELDEFNA